MRRLMATISLGLLLIVGTGHGSARSEEATFKLTDRAQFSILVKFFSQTRDWEWPGKTKHWTLGDSGQHEFKLNCQAGEKICYGAAFAENNKTFWGVGFKGDKPCQDCCITCGAAHSWNLDQAPTDICVVCNDGSCQCAVGTPQGLCAPHKGVNPSLGCQQQQ